MSPTNLFNALSDKIGSAAALNECAAIHDHLAAAIKGVEGRPPPADWKYQGVWDSATQICAQHKVFDKLPDEMQFAVTLWFCEYH